MASKYTKIYDINYNDVDPKLRCRISSIINFICDFRRFYRESEE